MKKCLQRGILFLIITTFFACEYEFEDDHYKHIDPPTSFDVGIELAGLNPEEVIYIYGPTTLKYTLYGTDYIHNVDFTLDGNYIGNYWSNEIYIYIHMTMIINCIR